MCACARLPEAVANQANSENAGKYPGLAFFQSHFQDMKFGALFPNPDISVASYTCTECAQGLRIEFAPEEVVGPVVALKFRGSVEPSLTGIARAKAFLCILAHGGFDPEQCRNSDCRN